MSAAAIRKLKNEAREAAWVRGHQGLSPFRTQIKNELAVAECPCGAYVQVDCTPPPNGIEIGGDAVALNCNMIFKWRRWRRS